MKKQITIEYIKDFSIKRGYECLSDYYINNNTKLLFKCNNGHKFEIIWRSFQSGIGCKLCKKYDYNYVKSYIESFNYILLEKNYLSNKHNLLIQCPKGHKYRTTFDNFKNKGYRCKQCFHIYNSGKNSYNWNPDRTRNIRRSYLSFDLKKINILKDDPNYNNYITSKKEAKESNRPHSRTKYAVDHIYPRTAFIDNNLDKIYNPKIIKEICNSRDNLQILYYKKNMKKLSKYDQKEFLNWFNKKLKERGIPIMGERGNIVIIEEDDKSIYFYTHWYGDVIHKTLRDALKIAKDDGRLDDTSYLNRIIFCKMIDTDKILKETTGFGISTILNDNNYPIIYVKHDEKMIYIKSESNSFDSGKLLYDPIPFEKYLNFTDKDLSKFKEFYNPE